MLRDRIAARERAEAVLQEAVALVLASLDLPPTTRIEVQPDGSMVAVPPEPEPTPAA
jgi:hypothetical protein